MATPDDQSLFFGEITGINPEQYCGYRVTEPHKVTGYGVEPQKWGHRNAGYAESAFDINDFRVGDSCRVLTGVANGELVTVANVPNPYTGPRRAATDEGIDVKFGPNGASYTYPRTALLLEKRAAKAAPRVGEWVRYIGAERTDLQGYMGRVVEERRRLDDHLGIDVDGRRCYWRPENVEVITLAEFEAGREEMRRKEGRFS